MLNVAQIKKLQSKIGKKVDISIKEREEKARIDRNNNLNEIKINIFEIESEHPDRGSCICIWNGIVYKYDSKRNRVVDTLIQGSDITSEVFEDVTPISEQLSEKSYYLMHKYAFDFNHRFMEFFSKNYVHIKIAIHKKENMLMLGSIFENFQKEFPECGPLDFKRGVDMIDSFLKGDCL